MGLFANCCCLLGLVGYLMLSGWFIWVVASCLDSANFGLLALCVFGLRYVWFWYLFCGWVWFP